AIDEAFVAVFPPPPVQGLGTIGGFKMQIQDRAGLGFPALYDATQELIGKAWQTPGLTALFSGFDVNVPQVRAEVDREKAKAQGVALADLYDTMQIYLGSLYANDFNRFGRTYQVNVQADTRLRMQPNDLLRLKVRNADGDMVPLGAIVQLDESAGPDRRQDY